MIFQLMLKTPDLSWQLATEMDSNEENIIEAREFVKKFIKCDEYVKIEFDTVKQTAKVVEQ